MFSMNSAAATISGIRRSLFNGLAGYYSNSDRRPAGRETECPTLTAHI
jgi:hypothetical protein